MTSESIVCAIQKWMGKRASTLETAASGHVSLTLVESDPINLERQASLLFEIPPTGDGATFSMSREGDDYETFPIPRFQTEARMTRHLQRYRDEFMRDFIYGPRFENWLQSRGLTYLLPEYDYYITGPGWTHFEYTVFEITDLSTGDKSYAGIHGSGCAATFTCEEEDILEPYEGMHDLEDPSALIAWIEQALRETTSLSE